MTLMLPQFLVWFWFVGLVLVGFGYVFFALVVSWVFLVGGYSYCILFSYCR